jgi:hypothetical protein
MMDFGASASGPSNLGKISSASEFCKIALCELVPTAILQHWRMRILLVLMSMLHLTKSED